MEGGNAVDAAADLRDYQLCDKPIVVGAYRGYTIKICLLPHGGPTLLAILNILEGDDLSSLEHNSPEYIYRVSMAMKAAFADRNPHLSAPQFAAMPLGWVISKARTRAVAGWQLQFRSEC